MVGILHGTSCRLWALPIICNGHCQFGKSAPIANWSGFARHFHSIAHRRFGRSDEPKLIDTHHHFFPPDYTKAQPDWDDQHRIPHFTSLEEWSRARYSHRHSTKSEALHSTADAPHRLFGDWFDPSRWVPASACGASPIARVDESCATARASDDSRRRDGWRLCPEGQPAERHGLERGVEDHLDRGGIPIFTPDNLLKVRTSRRRDGGTARRDGGLQ